VEFVAAHAIEKYKKLDENENNEQKWTINAICIFEIAQ